MVFAEDCLQRSTALNERSMPELLFANTQAIEGDKDGRRRGSQTLDATFGRMKPHLERIEREFTILLDDEFAIDQEARDTPPFEV